MMALEAALKFVAYSKLRHLLACNKSFNRADVPTGESVLFNRRMCQLNRRGAPSQCGPAKISGIDEKGLTATFQSQTFKVSRFCARKKAGAQDVEAAGWSPVLLSRERGMGYLGVSSISCKIVRGRN